MKIYRKLNYIFLNIEYESCINKCPRFLNESKNDFQKEFKKIYNKYSELLSDRYVNNVERLDSHVQDQPVFGTRMRKDRNTWFYWIFGY